MLLFFPDTTSHSQLQLLPVATGKEEGHVPVDDQPIVAISDLPVIVSYAPRHSLPCKFSAIATHLKAVAEVPCLAVFAEKS